MPGPQSPAPCPRSSRSRITIPSPPHLPASAHLAHCRPGRGGGISTWENFGNLSHLRRLSLPNAPPRPPSTISRRSPLDPNPAPSRLSHTKPGLARLAAWVTRRFILNPSPSRPTPSSQHLRTNSLGANRLQIISPHPCHRPVSPNTTHPCPHPDRPIMLPHSATLLLLDQTNWRPAGHPSCFPPVVLPTRPCPCTARRRQASSHRYRRPV